MNLEVVKSSVEMILAWHKVTGTTPECYESVTALTLDSQPGYEAVAVQCA